MKSDADYRLPPFGFEVFELLSKNVTLLPNGSATVEILPQKKEWLCSYVQVRPMNPQAAQLIVGALAGDLHITIGEVEREFIGFRDGGTFLEGSEWRDDLQWIWNVVVAGHFDQIQYLNEVGLVIGGSSKLRFESTEVDFRGGRTAEVFLGPRKCRSVRYDPYCVGE